MLNVDMCKFLITTPNLKKKRNSLVFVNVLNRWLFVILLVLTQRLEAQGTISLSELQIINFGMVPEGTNSCRVYVNNSLDGGCVGPGSAGIFRLTGEPYFSVSVSVSDHGWQKNIRLTPRVANSTVVLDQLGVADVSIDGRLSFKGQQSASGQVNLIYTITVNYQ